MAFFAANAFYFSFSNVSETAPAKKLNFFVKDRGRAWNGTEISVWNMEHARMEWKISRVEWKTIFYTFIPNPY